MIESQDRFALRAMEQAAPPDAPRIPGIAAAYQVFWHEGGWHIGVTEWLWSGKYVSRVVTPDAQGRFTYRKRAFTFNPDTFQVTDAHGNSNDTTRAKAQAVWFGANAPAPDPAELKGVPAASVKRSRMRRAARVLIEQTPEGALLLPGDDTVVYRVGLGEVEFFTALISKPKLKRSIEPIINGTVFYKEQMYHLSPTRTLYRPGMTEDLWALTKPTVDDALLAHENAPSDAKTNIAGFWYRPLPGRRYIEFGRYVHGKLQTHEAIVRLGVVRYRGRAFLVSADGTLKESGL